MQPSRDTWVQEGGPRSARRRLRVLESVRTPAPTTNPYVVLLVDALQPLADVRYFSWPRALCSSYDIFHVHWPEVMVQRRGRAARGLARLRFALLLLRLAVGGVPVVRTMHNVGTHEALGAVDRVLLRGLDRQVTHWIRLNEVTPVPLRGRKAVSTVAHGHYRGWFAPYVVPGPVSGRLLFFGLLRPYKQVPALIRAFSATVAGGPRQLHVVGNPATAAVRDEVVAAAGRDDRVRLHLQYADEETTARELGEAELVVLPYKDMHNSGATILALSLGRPVLVPRNEVTSALAAEVGEGWVLKYDGELSAAVLELSLQQARLTLATATGPDLSRREWTDGALAHMSAFDRALAGPTRRGRRAPG